MLIYRLPFSPLYNVIASVDDWVSCMYCWSSIEDYGLTLHYCSRYIFMQRARRRAYKIAAVKMKLSGAKGRMRCMFSTIYWSSRREFSLAREQVLFRENFHSKPPPSSRVGASFSELTETRGSSLLLVTVGVHRMKYPSDILASAIPKNAPSEFYIACGTPHCKYSRLK